MLNLQMLQDNFQQYILQKIPTVKNEIQDDDASTLARLEIYRNAYFLRLLECLQQDYSVLHHLLGDDEFAHLAQRYVDSTPSQYRSVRWYGKNLGIFLRNASTQAWLCEMVEFEWSLTEAFDEREAPIVSLEEMATIPFEHWPNMLFHLHPSLRRLNLEWNVVALWNEMVEKDEAIPLMQSDAPMPWVIWRKDSEVQFCSLAPDECYMLDAMIMGESFGSICEGLCQWATPEEVGMHAAQLLKRFILDNLVSEIEINL